MESAVIFCQAPYHVQFVLTLYEAFRDNRPISIYVMNVRNIYKFLSSLDLETQHLEFIPYPNGFTLKNPMRVLKARNVVNDVLTEHFMHTRNSDIYYFSNIKDWLTFACLSRLSRNNLIYTCDQESRVGFKCTAHLCLKDWPKYSAFRYITGIRFKIVQIPGQGGVLMFPFEEYGVKQKVIRINKQIFHKYQYPVKDVGDRAILLFEEDLTSYDYFWNYEETMREILQLLYTQGFRIFAKPHPRTGCSDFLNEFQLEMLPAFVPAEFIPTEQFGAILTVISTAVLKITRFDRSKRVFSLMEIFRYKREEVKQRFKNMFLSEARGKIEFVRSPRELISALALDSRLLQQRHPATRGS